MFEKHKQPSVEAGILIVLVVFSVFAIGLGSGNDANAKEGNRITGMASLAASSSGIAGTGLASSNLPAIDPIVDDKNYGSMKIENALMNYYIAPETLKNDLVSAKPMVGENGWRYYEVSNKDYWYVIKPKDPNLYVMRTDPGEDFEVYIPPSKSVQQVYLNTWNHLSEPVDINTYSTKYKIDAGYYLKAKAKKELETVDGGIAQLSVEHSQLSDSIDRLNTEIPTLTNQYARDQATIGLQTQQDRLNEVKSQLSAATAQKKEILNSAFGGTLEDHNKAKKDALDEINQLKNTKEGIEKESRMTALNNKIAAEDAAISYLSASSSLQQANALNREVTDATTQKQNQQQLASAKTQATMIVNEYNKKIEQIRLEVERAQVEANAEKAKADMAGASDTQKKLAALKLEELAKKQQELATLQSPSSLAKQISDEIASSTDPITAQTKLTELSIVTKIDVKTLPASTTTQPHKTWEQRASDAGVVKKPGETDSTFQSRIIAEEAKNPPPQRTYPASEVRLDPLGDLWWVDPKTSTFIPVEINSKGEFVDIGSYTPSAQSSTKSMTFDEAIAYLQSNPQVIDINSYSDINNLKMKRIADIDGSLIRQQEKTIGLASSAMRAETMYQEETIQLATLVKERNQLLVEASQTTDLAQKKAKEDRAFAISSNIAARINEKSGTWTKSADAYKIAFKNYDDATYNYDRDINDLENGDEAQVNRAINKIKNEYSRASEEERRAMMEEVRMMRDSSSATAEAQVGQEALYGSLLDMNEGLDIAQRFGATYNHEDGSFTKNGVSGWAFTKDGDIDLTVQRPATTQQKEQVQKRNQDSMIELHNSIHKDDLLTRGQDGLIYDSAGNLITELRYNHVLKDTEIKRAPPIKIIHSGKEQELTLVKDYTDDKGNPIYQTKDGTYFAQGSIWNDAQKLKPLEGSIYTIEHIGTKEKPDQVLIRVGSELNGGKKTTTGLSYSIIQDPKQAKDMAKDIPLDKDTLSLVRTSVAAGGSVKYEGDSKASSIVFKDSKGNGLKIVSFTGLEDDKDYVIAKDKMFEGSKSTQEYRLSYDKNHDGTITDEEKEEEPIRVSFAYSSEDSQNGKRTKVYAADNFKFGKDGKFTAEIVTQTFVEDKKSKTNVLSKDYSFYYIEVEESQADFKIEKKNGEPVAYDKDDQVIAQSVIKVVGNDAHYVKADGSLESIDVDSEKAKRAITAYSKKESRRWFADFQFHLTQFKGLSGWSQLIIPDEALNEWRENVDKVFSTAYLGTEYWTSAICKKHIPKENKGTFLTQTKDSLFEVVAHVEGEKTVLPQPDGKIKYLYKFTYSVRNPKNSQYKSLRFNVYLDKAIPIYRQSLDVKDGQVFSRGAGHYDKGTITYTKTEGKPVVQRSDNDYDSICIIFETGIIDASGKPKGEICNQIVEYTGSPEEYEKRITQQTIAQPTPAGPSGDPYQEMEI